MCKNTAREGQCGCVIEDRATGGGGGDGGGCSNEEEDGHSKKAVLSAWGTAAPRAHRHPFVAALEASLWALSEDKGILPALAEWRSLRLTSAGVGKQSLDEEFQVKYPE